MAEAAQHQTQVSWFCPKGPQRSGGAVHPVPPTHCRFRLRALRFPLRPVLGRLSRPDCKCFRQTAGQNDVITPQTSSGTLPVLPFPTTPPLGSQTQMTAALFLHVPEVRTRRKTGWTCRMLSIAALHTDLRVSTSLPARSPALLLAL